MTKKIVFGVVGLGLAALTLTGCDMGKYTEPFKDAQRSGVVNDDPADLVTNPDGFSNLATKCDHGNRIYVAYHGDGAYGSVTVVPNAKGC